MKRNFLDEINQIKSRNGESQEILFRFRLQQLKKQFDSLIATKDNSIDKYELSMYFPIAIVAASEHFFRYKIQSLIDKGEPYTINAKKFNQTQNIRFDFEIVNAIHGRSVTIGEVVSHVLSFNNLRDINSNFSTILGKDFLNELKNFNRKTTVVIDYNEAIDSFQNHHKTILNDLRRLYDLRHIFSHELITSEITTIDEIYRIFCNSIIFFVLSEWYIDNELYPNSPETTPEMINRVNEIYEESKKSIENTFENIQKKCNANEKIKFKSYIEKWNEHHEFVAKYHSEFLDFGTIKPIIYITEKTYLNEELLKSLERHPYNNEK